MKVIVDTNIYISALLGEQMRLKLESILFNDKIYVYYCDNLIAEIRGVLNRPKFAGMISQSLVERFIKIIKKVSFEHNPQGGEIFERDVKDSYLLDMAREVNADFLITGDKDLLDLGAYHNTEICTIVEFLSND